MATAFQRCLTMPCEYVIMAGWPLCFWGRKCLQLLSEYVIIEGWHTHFSVVRYKKNPSQGGERLLFTYLTGGYSGSRASADSRYPTQNMEITNGNVIRARPCTNPQSIEPQSFLNIFPMWL